MEVPDAETVKNWIGVDRGQNQIAVASLPNGFGKFWNGRQIKPRFRTSKCSIKKYIVLKSPKIIPGQEYFSFH